MLRCLGSVAASASPSHACEWHYRAPDAKRAWQGSQTAKNPTSRSRRIWQPCRHDRALAAPKSFDVSHLTLGRRGRWHDALALGSATHARTTDQVDKAGDLPAPPRNAD